MQPLTKRQAKVLAFVKDFIGKKTYPPTRQQICSQFGWRSQNSAEQHLRLMAKKGYIAFDERGSRNIVVL